MKFKEKVNIKQDTETFILIKGGNQGTQGLRDQSDASRNHIAFIVLFRIMSSEEEPVGAGYGFLIILKVI